ncbi:WD40 repeat-like protein [Hypomontagnella submonticulosa]|nr:WD40 repeat-like protein [Hypomontagnella submonticulosa]
MSQYRPAQPKSVLRGHRTQVHVTTFVRGNQRLASGDADGFVILWDLTIMRPRAVWRPHTSAILGIADWGDDKIITHGRDNRLVVWKLAPEDEMTMSTALPLDESALERPQPWILHILNVNTMNFCSFASCTTGPNTPNDELLIAVPNTLKTEAVGIFQLPSQNRQHVVQLGSETEKGMVMSLSMFWLQGCLTLISAYESGLTMVARLGKSETWHILYRSQAHSQPVLSLDVNPQADFFLTSSADAIIAKHPIPITASPFQVPGVPKHMDDEESPDAGVSAVSATLARESRPGESSAEAEPVIETTPLKTINTKHSGQQSLRIRSDGKIFATAGWDSKVRVYSTKTMSELAVLKWHEIGCYAVAFATIADEKASDPTKSDEEINQTPRNGTVVPRLGQLSVKDRRIKMAKEAHWLAAGSKDGKISLWDIY